MAANASAKDVLVKIAEVVKAAGYGAPSINPALLEEAGLLSPAESLALATRLQELNAR